ncbi:MAG: hypothetical protein AAFV07_14720 [Bacteroidota bacterium]
MHVSQTCALLLALGLSSLVPAVANAQVHIGANTQINVQGQSQLVVRDLHWQQDGQLEPGHSTIIFTGAAAQQIEGKAPAFHRLTVDKSGQPLQLAGDISVREAVRLDAGLLDLHGHTLDLQAQGQLENERADSRLYSSVPIGHITRLVYYVQPTQADSGQLGLRISADASLGWVQLTRWHNPEGSDPTGSIQRGFHVEAEENAESATVAIRYFPAELRGQDAEALSLHGRSTDQNWEELGMEDQDLHAGWITQTQVKPAGDFTLARQGIASLEEVPQLLAYPNPLQDKLTLEGLPVEADLAVSLWDATGRRIRLLHTRETARLHIPTGELATGYYTLRVEGLASPVAIALVKTN